MNIKLEFKSGTLINILIILLAAWVAGLVIADRRKLGRPSAQVAQKTTPRPQVMGAARPNPFELKKAAQSATKPDSKKAARVPVTPTFTRGYKTREECNAEVADMLRGKGYVPEAERQFVPTN